MEEKVTALVHALAERHLSQVGPLLYDGEELDADDVVELLLSSILVVQRWHSPDTGVKPPTLSRDNNQGYEHLTSVGLPGLV